MSFRGCVWRGPSPCFGAYQSVSCSGFISSSPSSFFPLFLSFFLRGLGSARVIDCSLAPPPSSCEFLNKLDLTVNFIDVDALETSLEHLRPLLHLRELFLMGNPLEDWPGARAYIVSTLPQLVALDGKEVPRSERIAAQQRWRELRGELRLRAAERREAKGLPPAPPPSQEEGENDTEPWSPEARLRMYRELAEQKESQEAGRKHMEPPRPRDAAGEHAAAVASVRDAEASGRVRQTNEGRWEFRLEDDDGAGNCVLHLALSRFLDASLIDVDCHPTFVSVIVRGKAFRVLWPEEVRSGDATAQRSSVTAELVISAPKVAPRPSDARVAALASERDAAAARWNAARVAALKGHGCRGVVGAAGTRACGALLRSAPAPARLADELIAAATANLDRTGRAPSRAVSLAIVSGGAAASDTLADISASSDCRNASKVVVRARPLAAVLDAPRVADESDVPPLE